MKTNFAPGPWHADFDSSDEESGAIIHASGNMCIAQTFPQRIVGAGSSIESMESKAEQEAKANALLIASAPQLFDALVACAAILEKKFGETVTSEGIALRCAKIALKKATGIQ